ncbi:MAG: 1-phosphofructokinase family hexose kinase [Candidatus Acidiferrales bacterium]
MPGPTIVCVSANPAMDRRLRVESLATGEVNRATSAQGFAGGKAAHVAMATRALNARAAWVGFLGGAIGQECARQLESLGIQVAAIPTVASTRVNLEIIDESGRVTEILEPGAAPSVEESDEFLRACVRGIREEWKPAVLVISGSLPGGLGADFYVALIEAARAANTKVFVDTSGEALRESAKARPDFVKVNRAEAEVLLERKLTTMQDVILAAREIVHGGVGSAAITLGREGLVWLERKDGPLWQARPPQMKAISAVGSGDATLAGFAHAATQGISGEEAVRLAAACGAANCVAPAPGRIDLATVQELVPQIEVQQRSLGMN